MTRNRIRSAVLVVLLCGVVTGCGGGRERGKNQDFDRPKATEKKN